MTDILIIEDNEQLQKYLCEYLQAYGFTAHILEDYDAVPETITSIAPKFDIVNNGGHKKSVQFANIP